MDTSLSSPMTTHLAPGPGAADPEVMAAVRAHLLTTAAHGTRPDAATGHPTDAGTPVMASLVLESTDADEAARSVAERALSGWLAALGRTVPSHYGVFADGLAGRHLGLLAAAHVRPALRRLVHASRQALVRQTVARPWRGADVGWEDYDIILGPAGTLLALAADPDATPEDRHATSTHLVRLCDRTDLDRLRVRRRFDERYSAWNQDRINVGVAHGVPGVALALCAALDASDDDTEIRPALRRIADWLVAEAQPDPLGFITWAPAAREGHPPVDESVPEPDGRHAWCYGTPGVAWVVWELGRVLGDDGLQQLGRTAFSSFLDAGCPNGNLALRESLAICHGDAGLLLLCDAFHRHAGLAAAGAVRDLLHARLRARLAELPSWSATNRALLTGPAGVLAALLTGPTTQRTWLHTVGLR